MVSQNCIVRNSDGKVYLRDDSTGSLAPDLLKIFLNRVYSHSFTNRASLFNILMVLSSHLKNNFILCSHLFKLLNIVFNI
jgi:hypothetical protein